MRNINYEPRRTAASFAAITRILAATILTLSSMSVTAAEFQTSDGVRLHFELAGRGSEILFVPGWSMPGSIFRSQIDDLSKAHRVITLDPRGQGKSELIAQGQFTERRARDIRELIHHLHLSHVALVGWSMGVAETLSYVDQFGVDDVRAIVLIDGLVAPFAESQLKPTLEFVRGYMTDRGAWTESFVASMYKTPQSNEYLYGVTKQSMLLPQASGYSLMVYYFSSDFSAALDKISVPLMYAYEPLTQDQADIIRSHQPTARLERFENAGHALFVDDAQRFNAVLEDFLHDHP